MAGETTDPKDSTKGAGTEKAPAAEPGNTGKRAEAAGGKEGGGEPSLLLNEDGSPKTGQPDGGEESGKDGEGKPGEPNGQETGKPVVPDKYDFKLPEGYVPDAKLIETVTPVFRDLGLSQENAQKLVDVWVQQEQARIEDFARIKQEWAETARKDPEFAKIEGGFEKVLEAAKAPLALYRDPRFGEMLRMTGADNHPEMIRFLVWVQKKLGEDRASGVSSPGDGSGKPKSRDERLKGFYDKSHSQRAAE